MKRQNSLDATSESADPFDQWDENQQALLKFMCANPSSHALTVLKEHMGEKRRATMADASCALGPLEAQDWVHTMDRGRHFGYFISPYAWVKVLRNMRWEEWKELAGSSSWYIHSCSTSISPMRFHGWVSMTCDAVGRKESLRREELPIAFQYDSKKEKKEFIQALYPFLIEQFQDPVLCRVFSLLPEEDRELWLAGLMEPVLRSCHTFDADAHRGIRETLERWFPTSSYAGAFVLLSLWQEGRPLTLSERVSHEGYRQLLIAADHAAHGRAKDMFDAVKAAQKALGRRGNMKAFMPNWLYGLALFLNRHDAAVRRTMKQCLDKLDMTDPNERVLLLWCVLGADEAPEETLDEIWRCGDFDVTSHEDALLGVMVAKYGFPNHPLAGLANNALSRGFLSGLLRLEALRVFSKKDRQTIEALQDALGMPGLLPAGEDDVPQWERVLKKWVSLYETQTRTTDSRERVIYMLNLNTLDVTPRLLKSKNGTTWSKGRTLPLAVFKEKADAAMTHQDRNVAACVQGETKSTLSLPPSLALPLLVDHPWVYDEDAPDERVTIVRRTLELTVRAVSGGYEFCNGLPERGLRTEDGTYIGVRGRTVEVYPLQADDVSALTEVAAVRIFPSEAKDMLRRLLAGWSERYTVLSDLADAQTMAVDGDARPVFRFRPEEGFFEVESSICPVSGSPFRCQAGVGAEFVTLQKNGRRLLVHRDLSEETRAMAQVQDALADFADWEMEPGLWRLTLAGCLGFLEALRPFPNVTLEWPDDGAIRVAKAPVTTHSLKLSVRRLDQWLSVEGEVSLDGELKLGMAELLEKLRASEVPGFIALGDGEYVALTAELRRQLGLLDGLGTVRAKSLRLPQHAGAVIEALDRDGLTVEPDAAVAQLIGRIREASSTEADVPSGLRAELRGYQLDGYRWMSRLAHWGAGAILADDMGLGKTLQTIALLASRAAQGPSLVIMPMAVLMNWHDELRRFAPGLRPILYNREDREAVLKTAGAGDVVLCTYGVLVKEAEQLKQRDWNVLVLDEAHTIKSKDTKTAKAALQLSGQARILLTGTPLQNNLGELWTLSEFANPGYLGSYNRYLERFVYPIERDKDKTRQYQLKRLITPFMLRRTKTDVLDELPQKTEMTLRIPLMPEERALYESIREKAAADLADGTIDTMAAMAALTRLRQAACHPRLIEPSLTFPSSKTETFLKLVSELASNGHRALVFSQFTSHLALVREALEAQGIDYAYLDGSMTSAQRAKVTEDFRRGSMPLFLISLKAGGVGLNLTAADYVIHLDPWWNPAVEDQASDRAYRIGQERPVTVYRLVAQDSIEEKILRLHETKRSMADALLEGTQVSSLLTREALLTLLAGGPLTETDLP